MPDISILSRDERRKVTLAEHGEIVIADYYTATRSCSGEIGWRFDHRAEIKIRPFEAARDMAEKIVNAPPRIYRGR
jgi:hypothetical protein